MDFFRSWFCFGWRSGELTEEERPSNVIEDLPISQEDIERLSKDLKKRRKRKKSKGIKGVEQPFSPEGLVEISPLAMLGYKVGLAGASIESRKTILRFAFDGNIKNVSSEGYKVQ